jgi:hypothetical protein
MRHVPLRELGYALGFLAILAALYVGAFYALVEIEDQHRFLVPVHATDSCVHLVTVRYRIEGNFTRQMFDPMLKFHMHFGYPERLTPDGLVEKTILFLWDERQDKWPKLEF